MDPVEMAKQAKQAIELPSDFGYFGNLDLGGEWGFSGISRHRDSDPLQRSNYEVVSKDLTERFPDYFEVLNSSHWAVGWIDQLLVRVYEDDQITPAFKAVIEWYESLLDYPVADEAHFSDLEYEEFIEDIKTFGTDCLDDGQELREDAPEDWAERVVRELSETASRYNEFTMAEIAKAFVELNLVTTDA